MASNPPKKPESTEEKQLALKQFRIFNVSDVEVSVTFRKPNSTPVQPDEVEKISPYGSLVLNSADIAKDGQVTVKQMEVGKGDGAIMIQFSRGLSPFQLNFANKSGPIDEDATSHGQRNDPPPSP